MTTRLPPRPGFEAIEAAAPETASRRTLILALIGNISFSWSNNESMFIYVLMLLLDTDQTAAAIVFSTLNTTRARLDLVQRLAAVKIIDKAVASRLEKLIERFNACTKIRNEFNHCMFGLNESGEITHTHLMKITETKGRLKFGAVRPVDDDRIREMQEVIADLKVLNRDLWDFLPVLEAHIRQQSQPDARLRTERIEP
ncbi:hypothetical protein [Microvirga massiliensis]|uniref:hypothetical protein n=1 Tax=Microvirga massiliensis TaxID=1033741 RepID=UPI00062B6D73|nr:hypothetical protein [Microvirga massiliensis]